MRAASRALRQFRLPRGARPAGSAAAVTFILGFGALCLFWLAASHPRHLRGLFAFRAATIGDGLLLPCLIGVLVATLARLGSGQTPSDVRHQWRERSVAAVAIVAGLVAGALTNASELTENRPQLDWTLPRPHVFTAAGWYHAVFLTFMLAAVFALTAVAVNRLHMLRSRLPNASPALANSPALSTVVFCATGFVGCFVADQAATSTTAGWLVLGSSAALILLGSGLLAVAVGELRTVARGVSLAILAAIGLTLLSIDGLRHGTPTVDGLAVTASLLAGVSLTLGRPTSRPSSLVQAVFVAACVLGMLSWVGVEVDTHAAYAFLGGVAAVAAYAVASAEPLGGSAVNRATLVVILAALFGFTLWIQHRGTSIDTTSDVLNVVQTALSVSAIAVVLRPAYRRFLDDVQMGRLKENPYPVEVLGIDRSGLQARRAARLARYEAAQASQLEESVVEPSVAAATKRWLDFGCATLAVLLGIVALLGVSARALDSHARGRPAHLFVVLAVLAGAVVLTAFGVVGAARRWDEPTEFVPAAECDVSPVAFATLSVALGVWVAILVWSWPSDSHVLGAASLFGAAMFALSLTDMLNSTIRFHLAALNARVIALAVLAAAAQAVGVAWLLSVGLWSNSGPAATSWSLLIALAVLIGGVALAGGVAFVIAKGLRTRHLTEQQPWDEGPAQQLLFAILALVTTVVPMFAIARFDAGHVANVAVRMLNVLTFEAAAFVLVPWVLKNNRSHLIWERHIWPAPLVAHARRYTDGSSAERLRSCNGRRIRFLTTDVTVLNVVAAATLICAAGWLGWIALTGTGHRASRVSGVAASERGRPCSHLSCRKIASGAMQPRAVGPDIVHRAVSI